MKKQIQLLIVFSLLVVALCACSESEPMATCWDCDSEYPEQYAIWDFYGDKVCPSCAQKQISDYANRQDEAYDDIRDYGEYISDEDYMVVEKAECNWCGNYAPSDLYDENGERICIDCITEALQDSKVARAIRNYVEYG